MNNKGSPIVSQTEFRKQPIEHSSSTSSSSSTNSVVDLRRMSFVNFNPVVTEINPEGETPSEVETQISKYSASHAYDPGYILQNRPNDNYSSTGAYASSKKIGELVVRTD